MLQIGDKVKVKYVEYNRNNDLIDKIGFVDYIWFGKNNIVVKFPKLKSTCLSNGTMAFKPEQLEKVED